MVARPTDWLDTLVALDPVSGAQANQSLMGAVTNVEARRYTVIRTLIRLELSSSTVAGAWGRQLVDIGIGIASVESFDAGVLPDPEVANDKPARGWLYRNSIVVTQNGIGTPINVTVVADVRGARKIDRGELFIVATNSAFGGTSFTTAIRGVVRSLMKL